MVNEIKMPEVLNTGNLYTVKFHLNVGEFSEIENEFGFDFIRQGNPQESYFIWDVVPKTDIEIIQKIKECLILDGVTGEFVNDSV